MNNRTRRRHHTKKGVMDLSSYFGAFGRNGFFNPSKPPKIRKFSKDVILENIYRFFKHVIEKIKMKFESFSIIFQPSKEGWRYSIFYESESGRKLIFEVTNPIKVSLPVIQTALERLVDEIDDEFCYLTTTFNNGSFELVSL